jgi:hypothetical protein
MATHLRERSHGKKDNAGFGPTHDDIAQQHAGSEEDGTLIILEKKEFSSAESKVYNQPRSIGEEDSETYNTPAETAKDLVTEVIHAEDDPTLNAWTFRVWFLGKHLFNGLFEVEYSAYDGVGIGLSTFGGCLATIYYFKPQTALVSQVFLAVVSYVIGEAMARFIPRTGWTGRLFNPHPVSLNTARL